MVGHGFVLIMGGNNANNIMKQNKMVQYTVHSKVNKFLKYKKKKDLEYLILFYILIIHYNNSSNNNKYI